MTNFDRTHCTVWELTCIGAHTCKTPSMCAVRRSYMHVHRAVECVSHHFHVQRMYACAHEYLCMHLCSRTIRVLIHVRKFTTQFRIMLRTRFRHRPCIFWSYLIKITFFNICEDMCRYFTAVSCLFSCSFVWSCWIIWTPCFGLLNLQFCDVQ